MERLKQLGAEALVFLRALVWPVASSVRDNVGLAALSVVLGFALWIFVTDTENPTRSGVLPFDLPVETVNVPGDLALAGSPGDVRGEGEGLEAGRYDLPVRVEPLTGRGNLRVTQVIPDTLPVELKSLFSKSVSVSVSLEGTPPSGYEASVPEVETDTVLVTGTQDRVTLVSQAVAKLDLTGHTEHLTQAVRLEARDSRGFLVEGVSLEPSVMNVSVEISQTEFSRALVISPTVAGSPANGYNVVSVSVEPAVATVFGPQSFVGEAATIRTQPIDITGASEDVVKTVALDLPAGVSVRGGTSGAGTGGGM